jgi:hypothetical protein
MKNIYEIFDEFEAAHSHTDKLKVIENNLSKCLYDVLSMTFHPNCQWLVHGLPDNYKAPTGNIPGMSPCQLSTEIRKLYLFQKNDEMAEKMSLLFADRALAQEMGQRARMRISEHFQMQKHINQINILLDKLSTKNLK